MILHGDSKEELKSIPDGSVDLICTDPPYGIGFMGKEWDTFKPEFIKKGTARSVRKDPVLAKAAETSRNRERGRIDHTGAMEAARYDHSPAGARKFREWFYEHSVEWLRVMKPGAFAFVCIGARQDSVAAVVTAMTEAGFKTDFTSLFWTYASGFPKAMNIGKMVDKRNGVKRETTTGSTSCPDFPEPCTGHPAANGSLGGGTMRHSLPSKGISTLEGSYGGFQPKPAVEVIIVAMKPLSEKTFVDQALKNGKGVTWLDDCRVPTNELKTYSPGIHRDSPASFNDDSWKGEETVKKAPTGRFPANLLVSDDVLNDGRISKSGFNDAQKIYSGDADIYGKYGPSATGSHNDSGGYSRFFSLDAWAQTLPFLAVPKASESEKNKGLADRDDVTVGDGRPVAIDNAFQRGKTERKNSHPTVKPLKLMSYLITLGSRPGDVVLDPFAGSGTTLVAAKELGREFIGIEREKEYVEIIEARLRSVNPTLI